MNTYQFDYLDYPTNPQPQLGTNVNQNQQTANTRNQPLNDLYTFRFNPTLGMNSVGSMNTLNMNSSAAAANAANQPKSVSSTHQQDLERLKLQLNLKTQMVNNLTKKLNANTNTNTSQLNIPVSFYKMFQETAHELNVKTKEAETISTHLEAVIIANTENHEDLVNKIIKKLNYLVKENEELMELISNSNKLSLLIELGMCKSEIHSLKEKLSKYEK